MTVQTGEEWSTWPAPAKLNLFLRILGRREDGYHRLQTVFQILDWGDSIRIRVRPDGVISRASGDSDYVPEAADLVIRAAKLLQTTAKSGLGADICVEKLIPVGGGFGGGSSDAATALVALDRLWRTKLGTERLAEIGLELGADVPVFVRGRNAWAEGVGEQLRPLELPANWFLVVDPGVSVPTRELFQDPELTRDAAPATIADFVSGIALGNAFEPVLRRLQPAVDAALLVLSQYGRACLTGTGSGCFLRFQSQAEALAVQAELPARLRSWVVAGAVKSPLLDAMDVFPESK